MAAARWRRLSDHHQCCEAGTATRPINRIPRRYARKDFPHRIRFCRRNLPANFWWKFSDA